MHRWADFNVSPAVTVVYLLLLKCHFTIRFQLNTAILHSELLNNKKTMLRDELKAQRFFSALVQLYNRDGEEMNKKSPRNSIYR